MINTLFNTAQNFPMAEVLNYKQYWGNEMEFFSNLYYFYKIYAVVNRCIQI